MSEVDAWIAAVRADAGFALLDAVAKDVIRTGRAVRDRLADADVVDARVRGAGVAVGTLAVLGALEANVAVLVAMVGVDARVKSVGARAVLAGFLSVAERTVETRCAVGCRVVGARPGDTRIDRTPIRVVAFAVADALDARIHLFVAVVRVDARVGSVGADASLTGFLAVAERIVDAERTVADRLMEAVTTIKARVRRAGVRVVALPVVFTRVAYIFDLIA